MISKDFMLFTIVFHEGREGCQFLQDRPDPVLSAERKDTCREKVSICIVYYFPAFAAEGNLETSGQMTNNRMQHCSRRQMR